MKETDSKLQDAGDKLAICLSAVCLIHCLALPIILLIFPSVMHSAAADELFHEVMLVGVLPVSVLTLLWGYRFHHDKSVIYAGIVGLGFLIGTAITHHESLGHSGETVLTVIGSIILASAHFRNARLRHLFLVSR